MEKYFLIGDSHLEFGVEEDDSYKLVKRLVTYFRPNKIIHLGDFFDFSYVSKFTEGSPGATEGKRLSNDIDYLRKEIQFFKKYCEEFIYLSGNHSDRLLKFLDKNPVLKGMFSIEQIAKEEGITFIPTEKQPYKLLDDLYITHGITFAKNAAAQMVERAGVSMIAAHVHRQLSYVHQYVDGRILYGATIGTLGPTNPAYLAGSRISGHVNGFAILYVDDGIWDINQILIRDNKCIIGGKTYSL